MTNIQMPGIHDLLSHTLKDVILCECITHLFVYSKKQGVQGIPNLLNHTLKDVILCVFHLRNRKYKVYIIYRATPSRV